MSTNPTVKQYADEYNRRRESTLLLLASDRWFHKACNLEAEGKSEILIRLALNQSLELERQARTLKQRIKG